MSALNCYECPHCGNVKYSSQRLSSVVCSKCNREYTTGDATEKKNTINLEEENTFSQRQSYSSRQEYHDSSNVFSAGPSGKSRGVAALLAILIGALGIHYFYVGKNTAGIICLVLTLCSCGWAATLLSIMGIIQGILMFTMSEEDFENRYVYTQSTFPF